MNLSFPNPGVLGVAVAVFVAVLLLLEAGYLLWQRQFGAQARRIDERLRALEGSRQRAQLEVLRQRGSATGLLQGWLARLKLQPGLERWLQQADLDWQGATVVLGSAAAGLLAFMATDLLLHPTRTTAWLAGLAGLALPWVYVHGRRARRLGRLEGQLPEALDLMARSLRAGHAFAASLQMVADEMPEPIAGEFRLVHDEVNFGLGLPQALGNLVERVPLTDLRYFVVAVLIQREAGGNLTELLGNLSRLMRARLKLLARVRVLSSEGRLTGWLLAVMPFFLGGLMNVFNPEFMQPLWTDPIGIALVQWLAGLMVLGGMLMRHIVRIRV